MSKSTKPICGRNRKHGRGICKNPAGYGTDHLGDGPCKYHGGTIGRGVKNHRFKHGLYSKYISDEERADFEAWKAESGSQLDQLSNEDEFLLFRLEQAAMKVSTEHNDTTSPLTKARILDMIVDIRLKAQKLRGGEKSTQDISVRTAVPLPVFSADDAMNHFDPPAEEGDGD